MWSERLHLRPSPEPHGGAANFRRPVMDNPTREQIIHRAYELWEQAGKPEGRDQEFYHRAEQELRNQDKAPPEQTSGL